MIHKSSKASGDPEPTGDHEDASEETRRMLHDLRTPLTIISGYVQLLRRRARGGEEHDAGALDQPLQAIESAVDRMKEIVGDHRHDDEDDAPS